MSRLPYSHLRMNAARESGDGIIDFTPNPEAQTTVTTNYNEGGNDGAGASKTPWIIGGIAAALLLAFASSTSTNTRKRAQHL